MTEERFQQAYLVRLWVVHGDGNLIWRASIEDVHTGERRAFTDLAGLCRFLDEAAALPDATPPGETAETSEQNNERLSTN